ncbi:OmpH family outer membrane protein [bacterium]|nr:OmpH family outer membrane protein [bacterium]
MKSRKILTVFIITCLFAGQALAETKFAYVDLQRAMSASAQGTKAQKEYEEQVKREQAKIDAKKQSFEAMQSELEKQRASLSDKARAEKQDKLIALEKDIKRDFTDSQDMLRRKNSQLVGEMLKKVKVIVEQVGKDKGYTMVFEKSASSLIYADTTLDITDDVIKVLDSGK